MWTWFDSSWKTSSHLFLQVKTWSYAKLNSDPLAMKCWICLRTWSIQVQTTKSGNAKPAESYKKVFMPRTGVNYLQNTTVCYTHFKLKDLHWTNHLWAILMNVIECIHKVSHLHLHKQVIINGNIYLPKLIKCHNVIRQQHIHNSSRFSSCLLSEMLLS